MLDELWFWSKPANGSVVVGSFHVMTTGWLLIFDMNLSKMRKINNEGKVIFVRKLVGRIILHWVQFKSGSNWVASNVVWFWLVQVG